MLHRHTWLNISRLFINQFVDVTCITYLCELFCSVATLRWNSTISFSLTLLGVLKDSPICSVFSDITSQHRRYSMHPLWCRMCIVLYMSIMSL